MSLPNVRELEMSGWVELYQLDITELNNDVPLIVYFCNFTNGSGGKVSFDSQEYDPIPVSASGFQVSGEGPLPSPTLSVSNIGSVLVPLIIQFDDLLGAKLTRIRTLRKHLDDGSDPDPTLKDVGGWIVERKTLQTSEVISWELKSKIDVKNKRLPGRTIQSSCPHSYRFFNGVQFVQGTCPYTGNSYFDENDRRSSIDRDSCGKRVSSCAIRFGENNELPMRGFPSVPYF
jgi:lambda family phage minor tail protein L